MGSVYAVPVDPNVSMLKPWAWNNGLHLRVMTVSSYNDLHNIALVNGTPSKPVYAAGYTNQNGNLDVLFASAASYTVIVWNMVHYDDVYGDYSYTRLNPSGDSADIGIAYSSLQSIGNGSSIGGWPVSQCTWMIDPYSSKEDAVAALGGSVVGNVITYRLTNCTAPGAPERATSGSRVEIALTPNAGFEFINPSSDIYVTNNGVAVVASYANGHLSFTMP